VRWGGGLVRWVGFRAVVGWSVWVGVLVRWFYDIIMVFGYGFFKKIKGRSLWVPVIESRITRRISSPCVCVCMCMYGGFMILLWFLVMVFLKK